MSFLYLLAFLAIVLVSLAGVNEKDKKGQLPKCEFDTEVQFYTADIEIYPLSDCSELDKLTIGFLIQDVVDEVETFKMPEYREEWMRTNICPYPEVTDEALLRKLAGHQELSLALPNRALQIFTRYLYRSSGTCRRCTTSNYDRKLKETASSVCSVAKRALAFQDQAEYAAETCDGVLERIKEKSRDDVFQNVNLGEILLQAEGVACECRKARALATKAGESAKKRCVAAAYLRTSSENVLEQVENEVSVAMDAVARAKTLLSQIRRFQHDLNTLSYIHEAASRRELNGKVRLLQQREICSYADSASDQADRANGALEESTLIVQEMEDLAKIPDTDEAWKFYEDAEKILERARSETEKAEKAEDVVISLCGSASGSTYSSKTLTKAQKESDKAAFSAEKAEQYLEEIRELQREMNEIFSSSNSSGNVSGQTAPNPVSQSFGVKEIILVNAANNRDIPGALDCDPVNRCYGSATRFNMRAEVFGNVKQVFLSIDGPIKESRTEKTVPYSVLGDDGFGDFIERELPIGTYTITTKAFNANDDESPEFTKTFTVAPLFGVADFVLVDAQTNKDLKGALDCDPINSCTGSATRFNIRADVFGDVKQVFLSINGPVKESRTEGIAPFAVFSDDGKGDYYEKELPPGTYTIMAEAFSYDNEKSSPLTKTFTVATASAMQAMAQAKPHPAPSPIPAPSASPTYSPSSSPSAMPTQSPSKSPSVLPSTWPSLSPSQPPSTISVQSLDNSQDDEYLSRLSSNLESSNTECEEVTQAILQKTLAEEAGLIGDAVYDELMERARGYNGNADVDRIKLEAEMAHLQVQDKVAQTAAAATLASELCTEAQNAPEGGYEELVKEEAEVATGAAIESRQALSEEKISLNKMQEVVGLIEFDPVMVELEAAIEEDEAKLLDHLDAVESEISQVESQINELPDLAPKVAVLKTKKESLAEEEAQIKYVLSNEEQFRSSQSALKKDEMYESVAPDFVESPPLQYRLNSRQHHGILAVDKNWDPEDEIPGSKEDWFRRFGDYLAEDVPARLMKVYNKSGISCINEDVELFVDVTITELESVWEALGAFDPVSCTLDIFGKGKAESSSGAESIQTPKQEPSQMPSAAPSPKCSTTSSGPAPAGGRAIWSSTTSSMSWSPYYREFDGSSFNSTTSRGTNAIFRYIVGHGASSPVCYEQLFVGITANNMVSGTRWDGQQWQTISMDKTNVLGTLGTVKGTTWNSIVGAYASKSGQAIVVYNKFDKAASPRFSVWDNTRTGSWPDSKDVDPSYSGGEPEWFDVASSPLSNEIVLAFCDNSQRIFVAVWNGSSWSPTKQIATGLFQAGVGVAYEAKSGRAMVVYGKTSKDNAYYRIWNGSVWESERSAFPLGTASAINWVVLRSDPNSNRLVLGTIIDNGCFWLSVWNGSTWEATEKGFCDVAAIDHPSISVAFESKSGDALAVFGLSGNPKVLYRTLSKGGKAWSSDLTAGTARATPTSMALYANPDLDSDQIMLMVQNEQNGLYAEAWNGSKFASETFVELDTNTGQDSYQPFSFLWNPTNLS